MTLDNSSMETEDIQRTRKNNYQVKKNFFKGKTFTINEKSFENTDDSEIYMENMRKIIIENGGKIMDHSEKAHFIIQEDGFAAGIWSNLDSNGAIDDKNRRVIHFRWVTESLKENALLDEVNAMHLCPMPRAIPVKSFEAITVEFTLCEDIDKVVFPSMATLYGFNRKYEDGVTDYLVVFGTDIEKSKTIRHCLKHFKKKMPHIV